MIETKKEMMECFDCDEVGVLREYVGCKTHYDKDGGRWEIKVYSAGDVAKFCG